MHFSSTCSPPVSSVDPLLIRTPPLSPYRAQGRKYFDSGDFALSQAHRPSDAGAVATGTEHPLRATTNHPLARVPGASNVDQDANRELPSSPSSPSSPSAEMKQAQAQVSHLRDEMAPLAGGGGGGKPLLVDSSGEGADVGGKT